MSDSPRLGITDLEEGQAAPETSVNENIRTVEQGANVFIVTDRVTAPPGSPVDGRTYLIIATATGAFAGKENQLALRVGSTWRYVTPIKGTRAYVQDENLWYHYVESATEWRAGDQSLIIAVSDETTALTTGNAKLTFRMPYSFALAKVKASVGTAPTGAALTVDINEEGVSILSTKITIDAGEKTTATAATPSVISDAVLADDAEITIDIDQIGSTIAGAGLKVYFIGSRI
jgi:hypothetical protein